MFLVYQQFQYNKLFGEPRQPLTFLPFWYTIFQMNQYEITYLVNPKTQEDAREKLNQGVDAKIADLEGKLVHSSPTLRKNLGNAIQDERAAFLRTIQLELDPAKIDKIKDMLKREKSVLRFTILNTPKRQDAGTELLEKAQQKPGREKIAKQEVEKKPAKKVTMKDVEKGIEKALSEEVK